jgi:hypothetical protein
VLLSSVHFPPNIVRINDHGCLSSSWTLDKGDFCGSAARRLLVISLDFRASGMFSSRNRVGWPNAELSL